MFALRIEYLTGRAVATRYDDRDEAEWPPHPARMFSALVAAWAEEPHPDPQERLALLWLEQQGPPALACSSASRRQVVTHFVPVNDPTLLPAALHKARVRETETVEALEALRTEGTATAAKLRSAEKAVTDARSRYAAELLRASSEATANAASLAVAAALLPEGRVRQPRSFPSVTPDDPCVHLVWPRAEAGVHAAALATLAARVTRLGHSASLVAVRVVDRPPSPNWWPSDTGEQVMRSVAPGQLQRLVQAWELHQGVEGRVLPFQAQRYTQGLPVEGEALPQGDFSDDWIVFERVDGSPLGLGWCVALSRAMRGALMRHADQPVHEFISGHQPDGRPSALAHLAILPLGHVGHRHADGRVMGVALVLPRGVDAAARRAMLKAIGAWEAAARLEAHAPDALDTPVLTVGLGKGLTLRLQRVEWGQPGPRALRPATWCSASRVWTTVTPVALDRNPGRLDAQGVDTARKALAAAREIVASACQRQGLPLPVRVEFSPAPQWAGAQPVHAHPPFPPGPGRLKRTRTHLRVEFAQPVRGPLLLGAGRFSGLGLLRPEGPQAAVERQEMRA